MPKCITFGYDALARQISRVDSTAGVTTTSPLFTTTYNWVYDTLKKGLLTSQSGNDYSESYTYNDKSQVKTQAFFAYGLVTPKTFTYSYDTFGRPTTLQYPSGLVVTQVYHSAGQAVRTQNASGTSLWRLGNTLNAQGNATHQWLGNGVVTQQTFDAKNGQITAIKSGLPGANVALLSGTLQNLTYDWDSNGNLKSRKSTRVGTGETLNEAYTYDNLNRVKTVTASGVDPTTTTRTYGYDALGNLTSDLTGTVLSTLTYPTTGNVYGVKTAGGKTYGYNAYGNVTTRGTETNTYDVFNKPTKLGAVQFFYGPNGEKYKQVNNGVVTWYFNNGLYEYSCYPQTPCSAGSETSYAGAYVYKSSWASGNGGLSEYYLLRDHLGSVDTVTNSSGTAIQQMSFDAFGKRRLSNWKAGDPTGGKSNTFVTSKGYTDHDELDNLGLIHMVGRVYDPAIGRFLSADLFVQSPYDSQSFNRYSYVRNNPLGRTDPTGYEEVEEVVAWGIKEKPDFSYMKVNDLVQQLNAMAANSAIPQEDKAAAIRAAVQDYSAANGVDANSLSKAIVDKGYEGDASAQTNPAVAIAERALKDGRLTLREANKIWRANNDPKFQLTVDASKLSVMLTNGRFNPNGNTGATVLGLDFFVHGSVTIHRGTDGLTIRPGPYDFDQQKDRPVRNFETARGLFLAKDFGRSEGVDFLINYSGNPYVTNGPAPIQSFWPMQFDSIC